MSKSVFLGAALLGCLLISIPAHATSLIVSGSGELLGARRVLVDGNYYNVRFLDGSCWDVYGICMTPNFTFPSETGALNASSALLAQVFLDGPLGAFDTDPSLINGCESSICDVMTPFRASGGLVVHGAVADNQVLEADDVALTLRTDAFGSTVGADDRVWARWQPSSVPEPSTFVLLGIGLTAISVRKAFSNRRSLTRS